MTLEITSRDFALKLAEIFADRYKVQLLATLPKETTIAQIDKLVADAVQTVNAAGWEASEKFSHIDNFPNASYRKMGTHAS